MKEKLGGNHVSPDPKERAPYGFMVLLGFFSRAGIMINNGIVLIDRIQIEEAAGLEPLEAVVTACFARHS